MSLISNSSAWAADEHKMFADTTRKLFDAEMAPNVEKWADQGIVDRDFWRTVGEQGVDLSDVALTHHGVAVKLGVIGGQKHLT